MHPISLAAWLLVAALLLAPGASAGTLSVLTYNVAGLPEGLSGSHPATNTVLISPLLNDHDLVLVQEDFFYHDDLISQVTHPYLTLTDETVGAGGLPLGDGLNTLSRSAFTDFARITWNDCFGLFTNASDCLTPKGFSFARHELEPGSFLDVYNWHADAGSAEEDKEARRSNVRQLYGTILTRSAGNAVLVMGDANSRYTRDGDIIPEMLTETGLTDVWLELVRGGSVPALGPSLNAGCDTDPAGFDCERIDKILYRSSSQLLLTPLSYAVPADFLDGAGEPLSDHDPVSTVFGYTVIPEPSTALLLIAGLLVLCALAPRSPANGPPGCRSFALEKLR